MVSSHLFALYTEMIMWSIDDMGGIKLGDTVINNVMLESQMQQLMDIVVEESEAKGLFLNSA